MERLTELLGQDFHPEIAIKFRSGDSLTIGYTSAKKRKQLRGKSYIVDIAYHVNGARKPNKLKIDKVPAKTLDTLDEVEATYFTLEKKVVEGTFPGDYTRDILGVLSSWKAVTVIDTLFDRPKVHPDKKKLVGYVDDNMFGAIGYFKEKVYTKPDGPEIMWSLLRQSDHLLIHLGMSLSVPSSSQRLFREGQEDLQRIAAGDISDVQQRAQTILSKDFLDAFIFVPTSAARLRLTEEASS